MTPPNNALMYINMTSVLQSFLSSLPHDIESAYNVLTSSSVSGWVTFPAPPSEGSLIKTTSALKVPASDMVSCHEKMKLMYKGTEQVKREKTRGELQRGRLSSGVCLVSPHHMSYTYNSHVHAHVLLTLGQCMPPVQNWTTEAGPACTHSFEACK